MRTTGSVVVCFLFTVAATLALLTANADAQLVADGQTNTISGGTTLVAGVLTVGTNGSLSALIVTNAGILNVTGSTTIGRETGSFSNLISVGGAATRLLISSNLFVGSNGFGNQLLITGGGAMTNSGLASIGGVVGADSNSVVLTGNGSRWELSSSYYPNYPLYVGQAGAFNRLVVSNGGEFRCGSFQQVHLGYQVGSSNNSIVVTGSGSKITNLAHIVDWYIGNAGSGNRLVISNGGIVRLAHGAMGNAVTSSNNEVLVTGSGSSFVCRTNLSVGVLGSGNRVIVTNGATFVCQYLALGEGVFTAGGFYGGSSSSNEVIITGTNTTLTGITSYFTSSPDYLTIVVGYSGSNSDNRLVIANGAKVGVGVADSAGMIGYSGNNNEAVVTGPGSVWAASGSFGGDIAVGVLGSQSRLMVSNGGTVLCHSLVVGLYPKSTNNLVRNDGGNIIVSNGTHTALFDVVNGTYIVNGGTNKADYFQIETNGVLKGAGTINGSVTNCGMIFLTNADQMLFTGPVVNKGVIIAVTGTPRFGSTFTNLGTLITTASINVANVSVSGDDIVLQFNTVSNYLHEVQASTNVSSGLWQSLTNGLLGTGSPITFTDHGGALSPNRTYRVLLH